jgi:phage tail sheath gpL-like
MTIATSIPASVRRPGRFFEFNIASAARGLTPLTSRIAIIGMRTSSATLAVQTPAQVFSEEDADTLCGTGSEGALMCRWALKAAREYGKAAEIWVCLEDEPGAGTADTQTLTVTGPATAGGNLVMRVAGRDVIVGVESGAAATAVAADLEAKLDEMVAELPVTAGVAAAVVTCTYAHKGINGDDVEIEQISAPAGIAVAVAAGAAGAGVYDITACLDALVDKDYDVIAISNHAAADVADLATHMATTWNPATKRFRHSIIGERTTLATAQALATAADDYKQMVITAEGFRNTPGELAAYVGMIIAAEDDPALPFNDLEMPSLYLPDAADVPTGTELESALAGGLLPLSANDQFTKAKIVRAVTTKVTHNSVPFFALLDVTISKSMVYLARQLDIQYGLKFTRAKKTERSRSAVKSVTFDTMKRVEELEIIQNVDDHAGELAVETDANVPTRLNVAVPTSVVPPLNQIAAVMNLIVE